MAVEKRWEVVPYTFYEQDGTEKVASFWGARPYGEGWNVVTRGYTLYNKQENTYGCYGLVRIDQNDRDQVQALCDRLNSH